MSAEVSALDSIAASLRILVAIASRPCGRCNGNGRTVHTPWSATGPQLPEYVKCFDCDGTGRVARSDVDT